MACFWAGVQPASFLLNQGFFGGDEEVGAGVVDDGATGGQGFPVL